MMEPIARLTNKARTAIIFFALAGVFMLAAGLIDDRPALGKLLIAVGGFWFGWAAALSMFWFYFRPTLPTPEELRRLIRTIRDQQGGKGPI